MYYTKMDAYHIITTLGHWTNIWTELYRKEKEFKYMYCLKAFGALHQEGG